MKYTRISWAVMCCCAVILYASCKKSPANKTTCASTLHGYTAPTSVMFDTSFTCNHGIISTISGGIATSGSFPNQLLFTNKAAFNTADNCYYVFGHTWVSGVYSSLLYKITASGAATTLTPPAGTLPYSNLVYNSNTNKLYCLSGDSLLVSLSIGTSSYSATSLVTTIHSFTNPNDDYDNITVDNGTGDIYYATGSGPYYVEKYHPGGSASTVVATSATTFGIMGLRFNKNDNMLYAIKGVDTGSFDFVKINPSSGSITTLSALAQFPNVDMYSVTLDACANRYLISTSDYGGPSLIFGLYQYNMSGTLVKHDTTATFYQGLDAGE